MWTSPAASSRSCGSCARPPGTRASLAIGMAGLVEVHMIYGRVREASRLASETMALVESIGDPTLTVGLSMFSIAAKLQTGEIAEALRWSQTVIDLADGEPAKGQLHYRLAVDGGAGARIGNARQRPMRPRRPWVAKRPRPGRRQGPQHRPAGFGQRHFLQLRSGDKQWGAVGRRRRAARHRGGAGARRAIE